MYSLEAFLGLFATLAWLKGIGDGSRRWLPVLAVVLALMVYVHNWALFLCVGLAVATAFFRRERLRDFLYVGVAVIVLYIPWLPTLALAGEAHGRALGDAPELPRPGARAGRRPLGRRAADGVRARRRRRPRRGRAAPPRSRADAGAFAHGDRRRDGARGLDRIADLPAWTTRYFAVVLGPLLLVGARALFRAQRLGLFALVAILFLWFGFQVKDNKENANRLAIR
jgi:mannosyltransferase